MQFLLPFLTVLLAPPAASTPLTTRAASQKIVDTSYGSVQGGDSEYRSGVTAFKGIPFAAPPTGSLRWKPPQKPAAWEGIRNATAFGPECPQMFSTSDSSEDCLSVNIWRPSNTTSDASLPVYLWIYGGGFNGGSGDIVTYDGSGLALYDIIVVTFNYRLGPLGFLAHPQLSAESGHNSSGNYGVMDMVAALEWVHDEIKAFGGDPSKITVGGESAGSAGSLDMMWSPLAKNMASGVISESGALGTRDPFTMTAATSYRTKAAAEAFGLQFMNDMNVSSVAGLRNLSIAALMTEDNLSDTIMDDTVYANISGFGNPPEWRPVVDGYVIPYGYAEMMRRNAHWDIPVITGNNKDEAAASPDPGLTLDEFRTQFTLLFGNMTERFFELYPASNETQANDAANTFWRDVTRQGMWDWAREWREGGAKSSVYTYFFTHAPPNNTQGAFHGSELPYVFNNLPYTDDSKTWTAEDYQVQANMTTYWVNFIKTGNPNGAGLAEWPAMSEDEIVMYLGDSWGAEQTASKAHIDFVEDFFKYQREW